MAVEVRLRRDRLIVSNPGGLYGITVDRLGRDAVTSARNARLVAICQHARTPETGARVIEALATGIPIVANALAEAGLPPAHYIDAAIRFTVVLRRHAVPVITRATSLKDSRPSSAIVTQVVTQNSSYPETWPMGKICRFAAQIVSSTWTAASSVE
ncbi:ATP-binding protein [Nonomuraea sp. NPDC002799]